MPFIEIKLFEERLTPETEQALIERVTAAVTDTLGTRFRDRTWILLHAEPATRWGISGKPGHAD